MFSIIKSPKEPVNNQINPRHDPLPQNNGFWRLRRPNDPRKLEYSVFLANGPTAVWANLRHSGPFFELALDFYRPGPQQV